MLFNCNNTLHSCHWCRVIANSTSTWLTDFSELTAVKIILHDFSCPSLSWPQIDSLLWPKWQIHAYSTSEILYSKSNSMTNSQSFLFLPTLILHICFLLAQRILIPCGFHKCDLTLQNSIALEIVKFNVSFWSHSHAFSSLLIPSTSAEILQKYFLLSHLLVDSQSAFLSLPSMAPSHIIWTMQSLALTISFKALIPHLLNKPPTRSILQLAPVPFYYDSCMILKKN